MKIYIVKKEKGRSYESETICESCFGFQLFHEENGKPAAEISISHTVNYWSCILDIGGIDIEESGRKINPKIAGRLHPLEKQYLSGLQEGSKEWTEEFLAIWTAKEAYMKAIGKGLAAGLSSFSVIAEDLDYAEKVNCFNIVHFTYKNLIGALACVGPDKPEFEILDFGGINKKPAFDFAADKLAEKAYSSKALYNKLLAKGYSEKESSETIARLLELGYLNDKAFAENFIEQAKQNGKGGSYIKTQLVKLGLGTEFYAAEEPEEEYNRALAYAEKIFKKGETKEENEKLLTKLGRKLASQGYAPSVVYKVLGKLR